MSWTFPHAGKLVQDVTSITLANNTAKTEDNTVPANKRWLLLNIRITNPDDVTRTVTVYKYKEAAKTNIIKQWEGVDIATTGAINLPKNQMLADANKGSNRAHAEFPKQGDVCDAGNTISVTWAAGGASSGGTDADGLVLEYLEVDM